MRKTKQNISLASLIAKYTRGSISEGEWVELHKWISASDSNKLLFERLTNNVVSNLKYRDNVLSSANKDMVWAKIESKLRKKKNAHIFNAIKIAASIIIVVGVFSVLMLNRNPYDRMENTIAVSESSSVVSPTLITSDGKAFSLDENIEISENNVVVSNAHKQLVYAADKSTALANPKTTYNTIVVPKGGDYKLILADGTQVWLNSDTKLKYPSNFNGAYRKVFLEGEAYFDVTKDKKHPFVVNVNGMNVKVLGTSFNVNGYLDSKDVVTTLVEGKVKVENIDKNTSRIILPNEQIIYSRESGDFMKSVVNTQLYTSWRNGRFVFCEETLENIMTRLSRIYDIDVFYMSKDIKQMRFSGDLQRYDDVEKILDMLEVTKKVKFNKNKNTVIVETR